MSVTIDPKTGRRRWNKEEWAAKSRNRIEQQPEPYKIWASQKSHRPKHLDQNLELKGTARAKERKRQAEEAAERAKQAAKQHIPKYDNADPNDIEKNPENYKKFAANARGYNFDFENKVGNTAVVSNMRKNSSARHAGYYCSVCDCTLADSGSWLGHLNGRRHQRNLGQSVFKHKRSDVDEVKAAIAAKKEQLQKKQENYSFKDKVKELEETENKLKEKYKFEQKARKRKKKNGEGPSGGPSGNPGEADDLDEHGEKRAKTADDQANDQEEADMMAMMGFSGFSSSKKAK